MNESVLGILAVILVGLLILWVTKSSHAQQSSMTNKIVQGTFGGTPIVMYNQNPFYNKNNTPSYKQPSILGQTDNIYQNSGAIIPVRDFMGAIAKYPDFTDVNLAPEANVLNYKI